METETGNESTNTDADRDLAANLNKLKNLIETWVGWESEVIANLADLIDSEAIEKAVDRTMDFIEEITGIKSDDPRDEREPEPKNDKGSSDLTWHVYGKVSKVPGLNPGITGSDYMVLELISLTLETLDRMVNDVLEEFVEEANSLCGNKSATLDWVEVEAEQPQDDND